MFGRRDVVGRSAGPEAESGRMQPDGGIEAIQEPVEPPPPVVRVGGDQGGLVLPPGVEGEPGTGLDHAGELERLEPDVKASHPQCVVRLIVALDVWVQRPVVRRNRHAAVAELGDDLDGRFEPVVGKPIRVVAKDHCGTSTQRRSR